MSQNIEQQLEEVLTNKATKRALLSQSLFMFLRLNLKHYFGRGIPLFQEDMIRNLENRKINTLLITSFIGGGKTTIVSILYLLWEAFRTDEKKVIVHVSRTKDEAQELALRVQHEILWNDNLAETYGEPDRKLMTRKKISLPKVNTMIYFTHLKDEQFNYGNANILIVDDAFSKEGIHVKDKEERERLIDIANFKTYERTVVTGSIHRRQGAMAGLMLCKIDGRKLYYPIVDDVGVPLWPERYGTAQITNMRDKISDGTWTKSYLLDVRSVHYYHYWLADRNNTWRQGMEKREKFLGYNKGWFKDELYFEKEITLGKHKFTSPKYGTTNVFMKEGETLPNAYEWSS